EQRLPQRLELEGLHLDACAVGRLEERRVRRRHAVPAQRVQVGGELPRLVEAPRADGVPGLLRVADPAVDLALPEDLKALAEGVVGEAGEADEGALAGDRRRD